MTAKRTIDCLFIGHNEIDFESYEKMTRNMGVDSGVYRDLNLSFIRYDNKAHTAATLFNYLNEREKKYEPLRSTETFSAAISYLGSYLEKHSLDFAFVNSFRDNKEELARLLEENQVLTVGVITTLYVLALPIIEVIDFVRKHNANAKIIVGGPFISTQVRSQDAVSLGYLLEEAIGADIYVNSSQGEATLVEIIRALKNNRPLDRIANIYYKEKGKILSTPILAEDNRLEDCPVKWQLFSQKAGEHVNVRTSVSCPFSCSFCGFPERAGKYRTLDVANVEKELNGLAQIGTVKSVNFIDDTFNVPVKRFKEMLRMFIKNKYPFKWHSYFRCQYADDETIELMKESGCEGVFLGIESGNEQILDNMNKESKLEKYRRGIALLKEYGIVTFGSFITGFPGETWQTHNDTLQFIKECGLDFFRSQLWYAEPITPIWKKREQYGIQGESFEWSHKTMNSRTGLDLIDEMVSTITEPIWIPQYNFDFDTVWHLVHRGMRLKDIKAYLRAFQKGLVEKLRFTDPLRQETGKSIMLEITSAYRGIAESESKNASTSISEASPGHEASYASELLLSSKYVKQLGYWLNQLAGITPAHRSQILYKTHKNDSTPGKISHIPIEIPLEISQKLVKMGKQSDLAIYIILLTALEILIHRSTNQEDVIVISPLFKNNAGPGTFNDRLFIYDAIDESTTFKAHLAAVRNSLLKAYENQDYPFEKILEHLFETSKSSALAHPLPGHGETQDIPVLSDIICLSENIHGGPGALSGAIGNASFLMFAFRRDGDSLAGELHYNPGIYEEDYLVLTARHFVALLTCCLQDINAPIASLDYTSPEERKQLIEDFNRTATPFPMDSTLVDLFAGQVGKTPDNIAISHRQQSLTYSELALAADALAHTLAARRVAKGSIAGLMMERSIESVIAILAILKTGAAFLPIDMDYPLQRKRFILEESAVDILLVSEDGPALNETDLDELAIENIIRLGKAIYYPGEAGSPLSLPSPQPTDPAYIIYTSGTTGNPKGVVVPHRSILNYIWWAAHTYVKDEPLDFAFYTSISFDLTMTSIFTPLIGGGSIVVYSEEGREGESALLIQQVIEDNRVGVVKLTPSHLKVLVERQNRERESKIRCFIVGGENLEQQLARKIYDSFAGQVEIYNEYGPTEAAVGCMIYRFDPGEDRSRSVPIGLPISNMQIYLLNPSLQPVPIGAVGELYIGGTGLAQGYFKREELTAERFPANPFLEGQRMYRSGDLARRFADGNIEFLGRADNQVKIRGYRIELGEIEDRLRAHSQVSDAVVTALTDAGGDRYLCAYFVPASFAFEDEDDLFPSEPGAAGDTAGNTDISRDLRDYLSADLPGYMVPAHFVPLEEIPVNINGKVDYKALPAPQITAGSGYVAPRNEWEKKLAKIWAGVLGVHEDVVGIDDSFFENGGNSLKATILMARIHKTFDVNIPLEELFKNPWIRKLAEKLSSSEKDIYHGMEPAEEKEYYDLMPAQKRMYILQHLHLQTTNYNVPVYLEMAGNINGEKIEATFKKLVQRHEAFRTSFTQVGKEHFQVIHDHVDFNIVFHDFSDVESPGTPDTEAKKTINSFKKPFDLKHAPLLRVELIKLAEERYFLLLDMHHIISDGMSMKILVNDFMRLYAGHNLPPLKFRCRDYAEWYSSKKWREIRRKQEEYWLKRLESDKPMFKLPTDYRNNTAKNNLGDIVRFEIDETLTEKLKGILTGTGTTLFMLLLSVYQVLLAHYSGDDDILVGTPVTGRSNIESLEIIGMFVNMLVMRNCPSAGKTFASFLQEVRENTLGAFSNQDYQFDELVDKLRSRGQLNVNANSIADTVFTLQDATQPGSNIEINNETQPGQPSGPRIAPIFREEAETKFPLILDAAGTGNKINMWFTYSKSLFKRETVEKMKQYYIVILQEIVKNIDIKIKDIPIYLNRVEADTSALLEDDGDFEF